MRNLLEKPVTTDEILEVLRRVGVKILQDQGDKIGGIDGVCISEAISRLKEARDWYVRREDDHGNPSVVREGLSERDARKLCDLLTARGHKQVYMVQEEDSN